MQSIALTPAVTRRQVLQSLAAAGGMRTSANASRPQPGNRGNPKAGDEAFLDDLERQGCLFFWEQASDKTGQVLDRARNDLKGSRDPRRMASIAATGFGLTALCIADKRGYLPHAQIVDRVRTTLDWHLNKFPEVHGFYYHFTDIETGERVKGVELSSIDTSLLLCGVLMARAYFDDPKIKSLATADLRARRLAMDAERRQDILHGMASRIKASSMLAGNTTANS